MMATAKTAVSSLHDVRLPGPKTESGFGPEQLRVPPRVKIAMAMNAPRKSTSRRTARKAKNVKPPRKIVRMTAKPV